MKHELLAPAGNLDVFYAVINAGADAVYIGGPKYGARAYAKNFSEEDIIEAIFYAHIHNVKVYMTVNTLVKNHEMQECVDMMIPFYEAGLDGVIVQDIGIVRRFRKEFPDMEIHTSTQMSISDVDGAKLLKEAGAVRVVTSRELSLEEIARIRKEADIEVECFIHGALCYCYSGQCLLSSMIGGRSGNRGRCAQPCRLPYEVYSSKMERINKSSEIISLKDLCTIEFLPELLEAGIDSLKVEGRMKQASYAYTVVSIYRKYLDLYLKNGKDSYRVSKEDYKTLLDAGNRNGFTDGYYHRHNDTSMITRNGAAHSNDNNIDEHEICKRKQLSISGQVSLAKNMPMRLLVTWENVSIDVTGEVCQIAQKSSITKEQVKKQFMKTGSSNFTFEKLEINLEDNLFVPVSAMNQLRRHAFEQLTEKLLTKRCYKEAEPYEECAYENAEKNSVSVIVSNREQLEVVLKKEYISRVIFEITDMGHNPLEMLKEWSKLAKEKHKEVYLALPYVLRHSVRKQLMPWMQKYIADSRNLLDGILVRSYDEVLLAKELNVKLLADQSIYTFSDEAVSMCHQFGIHENTIPYELNEQEIIKRNLNHSELLIYGRIPLMVSAGCVHKNTQGCDKKSDWIFLKDRKGFLFPVRNYCVACYNVLYNSTPTCLFQNEKSKVLAKASHRFLFTIESKEQVEEVFHLYEKTILGQKNGGKELKNFTRGHFHRGVE